MAEMLKYPLSKFMMSDAMSFAFIKIKSKEMFGFRFYIILYKTLHKIKIE